MVVQSKKEGLIIWKITHKKIKLSVRYGTVL